MVNRWLKGPQFLCERIAVRFGIRLRGQRFAGERFVAALQRSFRSICVFLRLVRGDVTFALLHRDLGFDLNQRVLGFRHAVIKLANDLAPIARRVLHRFGGVVQQAVERTRYRVK